MTQNLPVPCEHLLQASSPLCISSRFALLTREKYSLLHRSACLKESLPAPLIYSTPGREGEFRLLRSLGLKSAQTGRTSMLTPSCLLASDDRASAAVQGQPLTVHVSSFTHNPYVMPK